MYKLIHTYDSPSIFFEIFEHTETKHKKYVDNFGNTELYHKCNTIKDIINRVLDECEKPIF